MSGENKGSKEQILQLAHENKIGRREFFERMGKLGVTVAGASFMLNGFATKAFAAAGEVDFKKHTGKGIKLLLNKHPYTDAMLKNLDNFKEMTGLNVTYDIFPEDVYFDKVTSALATKSNQYDVIMTGAYQTWKYGPARQIVDLNEYLKNPAMTSAAYDWNDMYEGLRVSTAWDGKAGSKLGGPGSKQWAIPWGFELNSVSYNKRIYDAAKLTPPTDLQDLIVKSTQLSESNSGIYGLGARGSRSWATIHAGFLSGYTNFGCKDFDTSGGKLVPAMNSPESKKFHKLWVELLQKAGPKNWTNYTWYEVANDLGQGKSAAIYDADIIGFFQNGGDNKEKGNLGFHPFKANPDAKAPTPNVWIWSLAMSQFSGQKEAAWYFMQWCTGVQNGVYGCTKGDLVDPTRKSLWANTEFQGRLEKDFPGYLKSYQENITNARIYFTPQQLFPEMTTDWAAALQQMYSKQVTIDEGLDKLAESLTRKLKDVGLA